MLAPWKKRYDIPRQHIKKQRHHFANKDLHSQSYGRKVMTNLNNILKSRDITLPAKVHLVKAMVFPVVMYGCESWTVKKAERQRIDAFELWCWRRLMWVPWTARRSKESDTTEQLNWTELKCRIKQKKEKKTHIGSFFSVMNILMNCVI